MNSKSAKILKINFQDFPNICRICLMKENTLRPLVQLHVLDIYEIITSTKIEGEDGLPKNICNGCVKILEDISTFVSLCKNSDTSLKQLIENGKVELYLQDPDSDIADEPSAQSDDIKDEYVVIKSEQEEHDGEPKTKTPLKENKSIRHSTKRQPSNCDVCGQNFDTKSKLADHQKKNINCRTRKYKCINCEKAFFTKFKLNSHMRSHTKETPYECQMCLKKFRFAQNLKRHGDIVHRGIKPFKCDVCGREFSRNCKLIEHKRDHSGEYPFVCNYCGLSFKRTAPYNYHLNLHRASNSEKNSEDLVCNICGKVFGSKTTLNIHKITHTKESNFLCDICGRKFRTKQILENHIRVHLGVKLFACKYCEKSFSRKSTLDVHILYHTKEKPFKCKTCLKSFAQVVHLKAHERIHNGERPYKCTYCSRTFSVKCNLVIHARMHTKDTTCKCTVCGKIFYESRRLRKHMKEHQDSSLIVLTNEDITTLLS